MIVGTGVKVGGEFGFYIKTDFGLDAMLLKRSRPVCVKQLLSRMLVILVREGEGTCKPHCMASLQRDRLRKLLDNFQMYRSCIKKIVDIVSCVKFLLCCCYRGAELVFWTYCT